MSRVSPERTVYWLTHSPAHARMLVSRPHAPAQGAPETQVPACTAQRQLLAWGQVAGRDVDLLPEVQDVGVAELRVHGLRGRQPQAAARPAGWCSAACRAHTSSAERSTLNCPAMADSVSPDTTVCSALQVPARVRGAARARREGMRPLGQGPVRQPRMHGRITCNVAAARWSRLCQPGTCPARLCCAASAPASPAALPAVLGQGAPAAAAGARLTGGCGWGPASAGAPAAGATPGLQPAEGSCTTWPTCDSPA